MFGLFAKSAPHLPSPAMTQALLSDGLQPGALSNLRVVLQNGSYSGRRVTYFRVFDPGHAASRDIQVRRFGDLEPFADLIVAHGHLETDGAIVLAKSDRPEPAHTFTRDGADRSVHGDDEQFVFPERTA